MADDEKKTDTQYFVFKANIPLKNSEEMLDWNKSCQDETPVGHSDYRWGKILHDHLFVKNFQDELKKLQENQENMFALLREMIEKLDTKEIKDKNSDLFK